MTGFDRTTVAAVELPHHLQQPSQRPAPPGPELPPASQPLDGAEPESAMPTMTDLRTVATDLDDIDEILARLDETETETEADAEADEGDEPGGQDPLLATR